MITFSNIIYGMLFATCFVGLHYIYFPKPEESQLSPKTVFFGYIVLWISIVFFFLFISYDKTWNL